MNKKWLTSLALIGLLTACGAETAVPLTVAVQETIDPALPALATPTLAAIADQSPTSTLTVAEATAVSTELPLPTTTSPPTAVPTDLPPPTTTSPPTAVPTDLPPPTPTPLSPPRTRSNVPAGAFPENHVSWNLITDDNFLFRFQVHDTNQGNVDGAGIVSVKFAISDINGNRLYTSTENTAGYCIFRGGEPNCNPWVIEDGRYRWGSGGPELVSGDYFASIYVTPLVVDLNDLFDIDPDDPAGNPVWRWSFDFHVDVP